MSSSTENICTVKKATKWRHKYRSQTDMHEILPGLYLGNLPAAINHTGLADANISAVLSIISVPVKKDNRIRYKQIKLEDEESANISKHFLECINFIHTHRIAQRKVLVHCMVGVSRSATIVIAYIMAVTKFSPVEVQEYVKSKRDFICPNYGFLEQLDAYKEKCQYHHDELDQTFRKSRDEHLQIVEADLILVDSFLKESAET